ncbi:hypothetical protein DIJ64_12370 [Mycobacterium leprae]|uniref:Uncharacterized protein n=1 Tax=Mycobacterium leprae TaxID=1769 RepID=A0AAD2JE00_MYCLR|nr:hypothetical protein DIJ64_12370 [Mycobacterium leprae]
MHLYVTSHRGVVAETLWILNCSANRGAPCHTSVAGLATGAVILTTVALGIALQSADPESAVGPPPDGTYNFNQAGVSAVIWEHNHIV